MWSNAKYTLVRKLGSGYQSTVWYAVERDTNRPLTIKMVDFSRLQDPKALKYLQNEQECLQQWSDELNDSSNNGLRYLENGNNISLSCETYQQKRLSRTGKPHRYSFRALKVPKLVDVFFEHRDGDSNALRQFEWCKGTTSRWLPDKDTQGSLYLVLEFVPGAPLNKHVALTRGLPEARIRFHTAELVRILGAIHERGYIYRDLKASNVIIQPNGRLKLIDFGFAVHVGPSGRTRSFCGTVHAMAPEIFNRSHANDPATDALPRDNSPPPEPVGYGVEVDWWALGILLFEMAYGRPPFGYYDRTTHENKSIRELASASPESLVFPDALLDNASFTNAPKMSSEFKQLLYGLLQANPKKRLGYYGDAQEIEKAPWFQDFPWNKLDDDEWPGPCVHQFGNLEY